MSSKVELVANKEASDSAFLGWVIVSDSIQSSIIMVVKADLIDPIKSRNL